MFSPFFTTFTWRIEEFQDRAGRPRPEKIRLTCGLQAAMPCAPDKINARTTRTMHPEQI
jgi:hypothetical protein